MTIAWRVGGLVRIFPEFIDVATGSQPIGSMPALQGSTLVVEVHDMIEVSLCVDERVTGEAGPDRRMSRTSECSRSVLD